jgi:hypothetical protein
VRFCTVIVLFVTRISITHLHSSSSLLLLLPSCRFLVGFVIRLLATHHYYICCCCCCCCTNILSCSSNFLHHSCSTTLRAAQFYSITLQPLSRLYSFLLSSSSSCSSSYPTALNCSLTWPTRPNKINPNCASVAVASLGMCGKHCKL